jgi:hypothetical protein
LIIIINGGLISLDRLFTHSISFYTVDLFGISSKIICRPLLGTRYLRSTLSSAFSLS